MPFPTVNNDMLDLGSVAGNIPVIEPGGKLSNSLLNIGNSTNQIVQLDGSGRLPALDGSQLTNLPVPTGGWSLLSSQEAVGVAQVDFTSLITATHKNYALIIDNIRKDTNSTVNLRVSANNGASFDAGGSDYQFATLGLNASGNEIDSESGSGSVSIQIAPFNLSVASDHAMSLVMFLYDPLDANVASHFTWQVLASNGIVNVLNGAGKRAAIESHNAIRVYADSGLFTQGTFKFYGIS